MVIQSGLEPRNTLLMVLRYSLRSRSCICFFPHLTNYLWLWNCSSVTRMMLRNHTSVTVGSELVFMRGTINVLQSDTDVWILFKWNDIKGFFPPSVVWICLQLFPDSERRSPALGIEPQTRCFSQLFIGCGGNRVEPLSGTTPLLQRGTHLYVRKCFSVTFTRTVPPLPARLSSLFKPTFAVIRLSCLVSARRGEMVAAER